MMAVMLVISFSFMFQWFFSPNLKFGPVEIRENKPDMFVHTILQIFLLHIHKNIHFSWKTQCVILKTLFEHQF